MATPTPGTTAARSPLANPNEGYGGTIPLRPDDGSSALPFRDGKRLRMAVVGVGHLGRHHARHLKSFPDVDLVGVVDASMP